MWHTLLAQIPILLTYFGFNRLKITRLHDYKIIKYELMKKKENVKGHVILNVRIWKFISLMEIEVQERD
jgi:hypothetical protein